VICFRWMYAVHLLFKRQTHRLADWTALVNRPYPRRVEIESLSDPHMSYETVPLLSVLRGTVCTLDNNAPAYSRH
jgi:hypothetical protein